MRLYSQNIIITIPINYLSSTFVPCVAIVGNNISHISKLYLYNFDLILIYF